MKKHPLFFALVVALAPLAWSAERIAVIPKGTTHNFWKSIESGARKAGQELGVEIIWKGPMKEDDRAQQISIVQQFVSSGISAIVLAPLDDTALRGPVKSASEPGITLTVENRFGGATVSSAQDTAMNLIDKIREADGIFCPNESTTHGMLLALRQTGLVGKKTFVGFDTSPALLAALNKGDIRALVAQNPTKMGYVGVISAVKALRGEPVDVAIDTGCVLVTKTNQNDPAVKAVLGGE